MSTSFLSPTHYDFSTIPTVLRNIKRYLMNTIMNDPDNTIEMVNDEYRRLDTSFITIFRMLSDNSITDKETALYNLIMYNTLELEYIDLQNLKTIVNRTLIELHKIKKHHNRFESDIINNNNVKIITFTPSVKV